MELHEYTIDELYDELKKRHEAIVLIGFSSLDDRRELFDFRWHGGLVACMGLLARAQVRLNACVLDDSQDAEDFG